LEKIGGGKRKDKLKMAQPWSHFGNKPPQTKNWVEKGDIGKRRGVLRLFP